MPRLIDAKKLPYSIAVDDNGKQIFYVKATDIDNAPTVEAVEVVHGRWIEKIDMVASYLAECEELFYECSVCNAPNIGESPYCPNCGADMRERNKE